LCGRKIIGNDEGKGNVAALWINVGIAFEVFGLLPALVDDGRFKTEKGTVITKSLGGKITVLIPPSPDLPLRCAARPVVTSCGGLRD